MENTKELFIDKYKTRYILISSLLLYILIKYISFEKSIYVSLIIRTYYAIASTVLIILIKQIKKYNDEYIYDIVWKFFSMIIIISMLYFILDTKVDMINYSYIYIECSGEIMLIYETFLSYVLSEYCLKKTQTRKIVDLMLMVTTGIILCAIHFKGCLFIIRILCILIQVPFLIKLFINILKLEKAFNKNWNIIKRYIVSATIIEFINIYSEFSIGSPQLIMITEIMHLINFRIVYSILIMNLVREPYSLLAKSLTKENSDLDKLNLEVILKNYELEKSINKLNEKNSIINRLVKSMPHPTIMLHAENDRIMFINKKFKQFAGIETSRELVNKKIDNYLEFVNIFDEEYEYDAIFKINGRKKYVYSSYLPCYSDEDIKIIVLKDNTSKVETNEIKKEIEKKQYEEKMRTQFLSSISHDLKTPINVIYSASQVEKIYVNNGDKVNLEKYNTISKNNCISLTKLTNNLIDASKINSQYLSVNLGNHNLVEVVEDNVMALVDYAEWNDVELIFDTNIEECNMMLDTEFMKRIILNLVSNAVKFTPAGGKIYFIIDKKINDIEIRIEDTGSGMTDEFIDEAFNRYSVDKEMQHTKNKNGTGIGLFVVKEMVEKQGGTIFIEKHRKCGTRVVMIFKYDEVINGMNKEIR
ncbi:MAG: HAMP domain-containing sensor histidine kinase [Clostridium sp.]|nr:HAMP domain-containing sensor histidine kinase [Clostridium sp.]